MTGIDKMGPGNAENNQNTDRREANRPNQRQDLDKDQRRFEDRLGGSHHHPKHDRKDHPKHDRKDHPKHDRKDHPKHDRKGQSNERKDHPSVRHDLTDQTLDDFQEIVADRILGNLQGMTDQSDGVADTTKTNLNELVGKLANRLLVAEPKPGQSKVQIMLNESSLAGTEVTLQREAGVLSVTFNTSSDAAARLLNSGLPALQQTLQAHEARTHKDQVSLEVKTEQDGSDADGSGDGRSRNRRDLRDEWEENN